MHAGVVQLHSFLKLTVPGIIRLSCVENMLDFIDRNFKEDQQTKTVI